MAATQSRAAGHADQGAPGAAGGAAVGGARPRVRPRPNAYALAVLGAAVPFSATFLVLYAPFDFTAWQGLLVASPAFLEWTILLSALATLAAFGSVLSEPHLRALSREALGVRALAAAALVVCLMVLAPLVAHARLSVDRPTYWQMAELDAIPYHAHKVLVLEAIIAVAAFRLVLAFAGFRARVDGELWAKTGDLGRGAPLPQALAPQVLDFVECALRLRRDLQRLLVVAGLMATAFMLQALAFQDLRDSAGAVMGASPDREAKLLWLFLGAYFTGIVALLFVPAYAALIAAGQEFRDRAAALEVGSREAPWKDWQEARQRLDGALHLRVSAQESFQAGISILAPFGASVVSVLTQ
jgi:hypothetical protein